MAKNQLALVLKVHLNHFIIVHLASLQLSALGGSSKGRSLGPQQTRQNQTLVLALSGASSSHWRPHLIDEHLWLFRQSVKQGRLPEQVHSSVLHSPAGSLK